MKKKKEKLTKRDYKILGITACSAIVIGTVVGVVIKRMGAPVTDYDAFANKVKEYIPDNANIMNKYYSYINNNDIEETDLSKNKKFTAAEMINIALNNYKNADYSYSYTVGIGKTIQDQKIRSFQIRNKDQYFEESISAGFVCLAKRYSQSGDNVTIYEGSLQDKNVDKSSYTDNGEDFTLDKYKEKMGRTLSDMFIYIISDSTVIEKSIKLENDKYYIDVTLDKDIASFYYVKQMKTISNLDSYPTFSHIKLHYEMTKDLTLLKMSSDELYTAQCFRVNAKVHALLDTYYFQDSEYKIPSLEESINYGGLTND